MTDKELRKLSRLELLELLLEASKENKKLKEKVNRLLAVNKTTQNLENLSVMTRQVENALMYANSLTNTLRGNATANDIDIVSSYSVEAVKPPETVYIRSAAEAETPEKNSSGSVDKDLYLQMMCFFAKNDEMLKVFPTDIENGVRDRIRDILSGKTHN